MINHKKLLAQIKKKPRVNGYVAPQTVVRHSPIEGLGLFAKKDIKKSTVVAIWGGRVTTKKEVESLDADTGYNYALEIYPGFYLAERKVSELDSADFINHSCSPNCKIIDTLILIAGRNIVKGEELTADFSSHNKKDKKISCSCGAKNCKKFIYFA